MSAGTPRSPFRRRPSRSPARCVPSPPSPVPKSKKCLRSASETACPPPVAAPVCTYPPHPSAHRSSSPTPDRHPSPSAPTPGSPVPHLPEIHSSSADPVLPTPPDPAIPDLPPHRTCSKTPPCRAPPPAAPIGCAPASAASAHPSPPPPVSLHPSAPPP